MAAIRNFYTDPATEINVSWFTNCLISGGLLIPYLLRRGRFTNSPPQFGQMFFISAAQPSQKVHS
jgi:hypothetical protein